MSDVTHPAAHERDAKRTRKRLLQAAIRVAGAYGPEKVTYRSVGAEAGMSHSLVRFYFGTREGMLTEAFEWAARQDAEEADLLAPDIATFGSHLVDLINRDPARQFLQYEFLLRAARGVSAAQPVTDLYDNYIAQVSTTLANAGIADPDGTLASLVFAALDGLVLQHSAYRSDERTEAVLQRLRELLTQVADSRPAAR